MVAARPVDFQRPWMSSGPKMEPKASFTPHVPHAQHVPSHLAAVSHVVHPHASAGHQTNPAGAHPASNQLAALQHSVVAHAVQASQSAHAAQAQAQAQAAHVAQAAAAQNAAQMAAAQQQQQQHQGGVVSPSAMSAQQFDQLGGLSPGNHEYEYRDRLRTWLVKMIDSGEVPGLKWLNDEKTVFRMPWKHAGRQDYNLEDSKIFMEWAKHSGRYREGIDKPEPIVWKTRLRCALNKMPDIRELPELSRLDVSDPYRVYELLPPVHKGNDDKIRRRVYKRNANGIEEASDGPVSPKMPRSECHMGGPGSMPQSGPSTGSCGGLSPNHGIGAQSSSGHGTGSHGQTASSSGGSTVPGRPFYPVFNHEQSHESDTNSSDERISISPPQPPSASHVGPPKPPQTMVAQPVPTPAQIQRPINYPIPLSASQPGLANNLSPSSFALALANCNPLVASDPMLSSSLTSLATQILSMEHVLQAHMNQSRSSQAECSRLRDDVRESNEKIQHIRDEKVQLQQTLLMKVCNSESKELSIHANELEKNLCVIRSLSKTRTANRIDLHPDITNSKLLEMLPPDQKLLVLQERLISSQEELDSERDLRQRLEEQVVQLKSSTEHLTNTITQMSSQSTQKTIDYPKPPMVGLESPPSSRMSESEGSEVDRRLSEENNITVIEVEE